MAVRLTGFDVDHVVATLEVSRRADTYNKYGERQDLTLGVEIDRDEAARLAAQLLRYAATED